MPLTFTLPHSYMCYILGQVNNICNICHSYIPCPLVICHTFYQVNELQQVHHLYLSCLLVISIIYIDRFNDLCHILIGHIQMFTKYSAFVIWVESDRYLTKLVPPLTALIRLTNITCVDKSLLGIYNDYYEVAALRNNLGK